MVSAYEERPGIIRLQNPIEQPIINPMINPRIRLIHTLSYAPGWMV